MNRIIFCIIFSLLFLVSCDRPKQETPSAATEARQSSAAPEQPAIAAPEMSGAQGTVVEILHSGGYTYLKLSASGKESWAAIPETKEIEQGKKVSLMEGMVMKNFHSRTLDRTFDAIIFSSGLAGDKNSAAPSPHASQDKPAQQAAVPASSSFQAALSGERTTPVTSPDTFAESGGSAKAVAAKITVATAKAPGPDGYTVAEIFANHTQLAGKSVHVQGTVAKVSKNIMGRHWVHIQDGSGDPAQQTHDLVGTTLNQPPQQGDIVLMRGTVASDRDFGAGYRYTALVENATFTVQPPSK